MAKQRTQRDAATKAAPAPVAGDRYTVAKLLDDLRKVDYCRLHPTSVPWSGAQMTEADRLEMQVNLEAGVARLRLIFDAEGSDASFAAWLRRRRAEVAIAVGDSDGSQTNSRTVDEFCDMIAMEIATNTSQNETADDTYFVIMRCWPGFTAAAPLDSFHALPDREAERGLSAALAEYIWKNRIAIRESRQAAYQRWVDAIKRQSRTILGPHRTVVRSSKSIRHAWRETHGWGTQSTLMRMAVAAGWHNRKWMAADPLFSGRRIFSPKVWLAEVGSSELANAISVHLSNAIPNNETEATQREFLNPRFAVVPAARLSAAEQATARASLARLIKEVDRTYWANFARPFLSHVGDFVSVWRPNAPSKLGGVKSRTSKLEVDLDSSFAVYAGRRYPLTGSGAFMLDLLVKADGEFVPMREHFSKPSEIKKSLAPVFQSMIETGSGKGYRLAIN